MKKDISKKSVNGKGLESTVAYIFLWKIMVMCPTIIIA
jgi:hypothetical protein